MPTILSGWWTVLLALPVLLLGEWMVRRVRVLARFNIPSPVAGGLLVSLAFLACNLSGAWPARFGAQVTEPWWTWLVTIEPEWIKTPARNVNLPFLMVFFTCLGLNASWSLIRKGSVQIPIFLAVAALLAVIQNVLGVGLAKLMGAPPLLGLVCGSTTLTGGHGTALGFAADFEKAGLGGAAPIGMAAATFGLVAGGLLGGPVGGALIRRHRLRSGAPTEIHLEAGETRETGILRDIRALGKLGRPALWHLLLVLGCIKLGAWTSHLLQQTGVTFPVYIGSMLLGVVVRNALELGGARWIRTETLDTIGSVALGFFLSMAMMSLNLIELAGTALPMLVILVAQVITMAAFAWFITYRFLGRDFDAAVLAGGHCGFGLGATSNAIASMKALVERFGPAPRAFLVLPIVGAFLVDLFNAANITVFLNLLK
jgi:ESS family glutamate:Na+ symporter